jgi:hypothetical protein
MPPIFPFKLKNSYDYPTFMRPSCEALENTHCTGV